MECDDIKKNVRNINKLHPNNAELDSQVFRMITNTNNVMTNIPRDVISFHTKHS